MNWGDGEAWPAKRSSLLQKVDELTKQRPVGLVGASAGAAAAINAFAARKDKIAGVVLIAGKVNRPEAIHSYHYEHNPALPSAVEEATQSLKQLDKSDRRRILTLYAVADEMVIRADSYVPGAHNKSVLTAGHFITIATQITFGAPSFLRFLNKIK